MHAPTRPTPAQGAKLLHVSDLLLLGRATIEESLLLLHWLRQAGHERLGEGQLSPDADSIAPRAPCCRRCLPLCLTFLCTWSFALALAARPRARGRSRQRRVGQSCCACCAELSQQERRPLSVPPSPSRAAACLPYRPMPPAGVCGLSMGGVHANMVASLYPGPVALTPLLSPRSAAGAYCSGALYHATAWQQVWRAAWRASLWGAAADWRGCACTAALLQRQRARTEQTADACPPPPPFRRLCRTSSVRRRRCWRPCGMPVEAASSWLARDGGPMAAARRRRRRRRRAGTRPGPLPPQQRRPPARCRQRSTPQRCRQPAGRIQARLPPGLAQLAVSSRQGRLRPALAATKETDQARAAAAASRLPAAPRGGGRRWGGGRNASALSCEPRCGR